VQWAFRIGAWGVADVNLLSAIRLGADLDATLVYPVLEERSVGVEQAGLNTGVFANCKAG
jgi:hypothetical protein